jgi:carbonic anhydrase
MKTEVSTLFLEDDKLISVNTPEEIPLEHRGTPVGHLLEYHNLGRELEAVERAEILLGMCMDNRKVLRTPDNFAFVLRTTGANLRHNEFRVAYAIGVGGVRHIALIAHTNCGMVGLTNRMSAFVRGMVDAAGWSDEQAREYFFQYAPFFEIEDEIEFVRLESRRLRARYPKISITPLLYKVEDNRLYLVRE